MRFTLIVQLILIISIVGCSDEKENIDPPIVQSTNPLLGTWVLESFFNGIEPGDYSVHTNDCGVVSSGVSVLSWTYVFQPNSYTWSNTWKTINYNILLDNDCNIIGDNEDTTEESSFSGTEPSGSLEVEFLSANRIQISTEVFVRQE